MSFLFTIGSLSKHELAFLVNSISLLSDFVQWNPLPLVNVAFDAMLYAVFILNMMIIFSFVGLLQKFLFGGRLIFGPDAWSIPFTFLLIITPVCFFSVFVATHLRRELLPNNAGHVFLVAGVLFTVFVSFLQCPFDI
jgi:hypothetical protein